MAANGCHSSSPTPRVVDLRRPCNWTSCSSPKSSRRFSVSESFKSNASLPLATKSSRHAIKGHRGSCIARVASVAPLSSPISVMKALLVAPGVKDSEPLAFRRRDDDDDELKEKDAVSGLVRSVLATAGPAQRSAFNVLDLDKVVGLYGAWRAALRGVRPYYAVKCNTSPALLGALAALGAGFDCASAAEIKTMLALGVPPRDIVYANACKPEAHLEYAAGAGVNLTTYDNVEEIAKIKRCHPKCELLLRLKAPEGAGATVDPGSKYGALAGEVVPLLRAAQRAGLDVIGVSFHVGTGASRLDVFRGAIAAARAAFDAAAAAGMPPMRVLDIGGGFVAGATFDIAAAVVGDALARHFGDLPGVEVIGEPGRYFAETAFTLAARVIGKRARGEARDYWIDDGLYGALNCVVKYHYVPRPRPLAPPRAGERTYASTVYGPTCDSQDKVVTGYQLPEMSVGDWLIFDDMGAYSTSAGCNFNGFDTSEMKTYVAYSS
ncbi:hypothetical protein ACP4OV_024122 [Aristida adscensionis]